jgi:hypothetical protein
MAPPTFDDLPPSTLCEVLSNLIAVHIAKAEQSCRSFKVIVPRVVRERERKHIAMWSQLNFKNNNQKCSPNQSHISHSDIPSFLCLVNQKSHMAFEASNLKGWCETLHIQEMEFQAFCDNAK